MDEKLILGSFIAVLIIALLFFKRKKLNLKKNDISNFEKGSKKDNLNKTIIKCHKCPKKLKVLIDKGTIQVKCTCGNVYKFNPFDYSVLEELTNGSYYLPDFENKLGKFNCKIIDAPALDPYIAIDIEPFKQFPIPERKLYPKQVIGLYELHNIPIMIYIIFYDTLEIYIKTTSYILDPKDENFSIGLMDKLKYIVSTKYGPPDKIIPMDSWQDYYWYLNYGLIFLSKNSENQVLLQLKYKSYLKFNSQYEIKQPSDVILKKVTKLEDEANIFGGEGDYRKCIEKAKNVLEYWPCNSNARMLIGTALLELGNIKEAEDYLHSAIEYLPINESAYFALGQLYIKSGKKKLAKRYLENYLYISKKQGLNSIDDNYIIAKDLLKQIS